MRRPGLLASAALFVLAAGSAGAAPLSEAQAVALALQRHPSIEAAQSAILAARGIAEEAEFLLPENPRIGVEHESDRLSRDDGERQWVVSLNTPIWIAGQRSRRQAYATERLREAELNVESARWLLTGAVRDAYWRVWQANAIAQVAAERARRTEDLAALADRQVRAREAAPVEATQVRAEALADRQAAVKAEGEVRRALLALAELVGEPAAELEAPQPMAPPEPAPESVVEDRPDLRLLKQRIRSGRAGLDVQDVAAWPNPEVGLAFTRKRDDFASDWDNTVTLGVTIPIPVVERNQRERAAASAEYARAQTEYRQAVLQGVRELRQVEADWQSAWERWTYAKEALAIAEHSLRLSERSYGLGELSAADLIQEKRRWADLLAAEREAMGDLALAKSAWRQAVGRDAGA